MYMYVCIYIYIYICRDYVNHDINIDIDINNNRRAPAARRPGSRNGLAPPLHAQACRTLVVDKWGQHKWGRCKSNELCQTREKVRPGTFGKRQVGFHEYPKSPSVKTHEICSDPISADPICPFPSTNQRAARAALQCPGAAQPPGRPWRRAAGAAARPRRSPIV